MNSLGDVAGYHCQCVCGDDQAFLWHGDPGLIPLQFPAGTLTSRAWDINDARQIVGEFDISGDGFGPLAFLYEGGQLTQIPPPGGTFSRASAVNGQGQVVGTTGDGTPYFKAFLWQNGGMTLILPTFGPRSVAADINEAKQIVGWMGLSPSIDSHAFLWKDGVMVDLGVIPGGFTGTGIAANNLGQVVVNGNLPFKGFGQLKHAFLWTNSEFTDLGTLPGLERCSATDINDEAQIVGTCTQPDLQGVGRPFIWQNGLMTDLHELILNGSRIQQLIAVGAINSAGQIVGTAIDPDGHNVAVLLTPVDPSPGDVDGDCVVNVLDLIELLLCFGQPAIPGCEAEDVNEDGTVNVLDLIILLLNFGS